MTELKPCPFCGDFLIYDGERYWAHRRTGCIPYKVLSWEVEQWNSRPAEDRLRAALENIKNEATVVAANVWNIANRALQPEAKEG